MRDKKVSQRSKWQIPSSKMHSNSIRPSPTSEPCRGARQCVLSHPPTDGTRWVGTCAGGWSGNSSRHPLRLPRHQGPYLPSAAAFLLLATRMLQYMAARTVLGEPPFTSATAPPVITLPFSVLVTFARHGPEVPKFVFMAVCFQTHGHAKSLAQFITISVGSPSFKI